MKGLAERKGFIQNGKGWRKETLLREVKSRLIVSLERNKSVNTLKEVGVST